MRRCVAVVLVAAAVAAPSAQTSPLTFGETFTMQSDVMRETRRINVYLPPAYSASKDARLPVLYMPDGGMAEDFLHIAGLVQVSTGNGTMRPVILVGIENTERRRDMTGPTTNDADRKIAPRVGGSAAFRQFIKDELMPAVTAGYRTTGETAIVGESLAGLFVMETFFLDPGMFNTYIAFDPSLWWNNRQLVESAEERLRRWPSLERTLYVASSDEKEMIELTVRLADALRRVSPAKLRWHYEPMPQETHGTIYHPAALRAFRMMFKPATP